MVSAHPWPAGTHVALPEEWPEQLGISPTGYVTYSVKPEPSSNSGFTYLIHGYWWEGSELTPTEGNQQ